MAKRDRVAFVTGAASGIGKAVVQRLRLQGARVIAFDLVAPRRAAAKGAKLKGAIEYVAGDVADVQRIAQVRDDIKRRYGRLDAVVNCAGVAARSGLDLEDAATWRRMIDTNFVGTLNVCAAMMPLLEKSSNGVIVNVGSELGIRPAAGLAVYASTKAAVIHLTKALAKECGASKVRVNCICPGPVDTPMLQRSIGRTANPRREMQKTIASTLMGRLAKPSEIAKAIEFLLSPDTGYMTGSIVVVDGGATI